MGQNLLHLFRQLHFRFRRLKQEVEHLLAVKPFKVFLVYIISVRIVCSFANMLLFCPTCGNVLIVEEGQRCMRFACNSCPYVHNITRKVSCETCHR